MRYRVMFRAVSPAWWTWRSLLYWKPVLWRIEGVGRSAACGPLVVHIVDRDSLAAALHEAGETGTCWYDIDCGGLR